MVKLVILFIFVSCTDLILNDSSGYNSIQLNGNAWIHITNDLTNDNDISIIDDEFTLEFWFTGGNSGMSESSCLVSIIEPNGSIEFGIFKDPSTPNILDFWLEDTRLESISLDLDLNNASNFHHIAITSNENIQIYINGQSVKTYSGVSININDNDLVIGGKVNRELSVLGNFWIGNFDEMRLWGTILNESIIDYHVKNPNKLVLISEDENGNKWWETTPLIGLWRFQFSENHTSPIIPDESCEILNNMYSYTASCTQYNATIYTLNNNVANFSEKHP